MTEDTGFFGLLLKYLAEKQRHADVKKVQEKIAQGNYNREDAMIDYPGLPWSSILQPKTAQAVVLPADPPAKRGRAGSSGEESPSDSLDEADDPRQSNPPRAPRNRPTTLLNHDSVNSRWVKLARPRGGEKLTQASMEALSQVTQEYMKAILENVHRVAQARNMCQITNFENTVVTSKPSEVLKEVEEREKEERKEQLRQEQQLKQRKRARDDVSQTITDAMASSKRTVAVQDIDVPLAPVREVVTMRDVLSVLESDPQWRKSPFLQRIYTCGVSERPQYPV